MGANAARSIFSAHVGGDAKHEPVGPQRVLHRVALTQELGVPCEFDQVRIRRRLLHQVRQAHRGTDRNGGLADEEGGLGDALGESR